MDKSHAVPSSPKSELELMLGEGETLHKASVSAAYEVENLLFCPVFFEVRTRQRGNIRITTK